ncbi:MAG: bifunctional glutamate N-acetyltransferase/amino-acid acetyltransferase ArgJ [Pseudomonadota bacterium]
MAKKDGKPPKGPKEKKPKKAKRLEDRAANLREKLARVEAKIAEAKGISTAATDISHVSRFAKPFPDLAPVGGVRLATARVGIKKSGQKDVMLAEIAEGSTIAGVLTKSSTRSGPVDWCRARLAGIKKKAPKGPLAIVVNSGNANAFTGNAGLKGAEATAIAAAKALRGKKEGVFIASTGVIGEPLPTERITEKMAELKASLSANALPDAAAAIMTTDTFPKGAGRTIMLDDVEVHISGIAKGSGMIAPDMATMLAFVFTDAPIGQRLLQSMVSEGTKGSFNAATVDSDTSTSDTLLVAATGKAGGKPIRSRRDPRAAAFEVALNEVLVDLAQQIVRDGEGITKYVAIKVTGAKSDNSAGIIARSIANSPLVKTAIAGADPNWGRIVMAVGKSGQPADRDLLSIRFGEILVAEKGWVSPDYTEKAGAKYMKQDEIEITIDLGIDTGTAEVWTCDLTHRYIEINADYRS